MISSLLAFLVIGAPPSVEITPKETVIRQGQITIKILPDGSMQIKSPSANLSLPGSDVAPAPDDFADAIKAIYGADQDKLKKVKLGALIKSYESALQSIDQAKIVGDFAQLLIKSQTIKPDDLRPLRDRIAQEIKTQIGTDPDSPLDAMAAKDLFTKLIANLKGLE